LAAFILLSGLIALLASRAKRLQPHCRAIWSCRTRMAPMDPRRGAAIMVTATALVAAGCGGGLDDTAKVKQTMTRYLSAVGAGDGATTCSLLTPSGQAAFERFKRAAAGSCPLLVTVFNAGLPAQVKTALRHAQIKKITINGNTATVRHADITSTKGDLSSVVPPGSPPTVLTKQSDGSWKLS
jgi:tripartite-type tricarboxylate transporter receptor subunit TctC